MLERFGKTPADLGMDWEDVDPVWQDAMLLIDGARAEEANRQQKKSP